MPGRPQSRAEVGETIARFSTYEGAQKAVSQLIAHEVPAREIAIVGTGLRSVERVTGRLGYATAARTGAINGLLLGLLFAAVFVLGNPSVPMAAFIGVMFVGIAVGMLLSIVSYSVVRRRRDYASVMQVLAEHYEVTVLPASIHRARQVLGAGSAPRPSEPPARAAAPEPPRYGERLPVDGGPDAGRDDATREDVARDEAGSDEPGRDAAGPGSAADPDPHR